MNEQEKYDWMVYVSCMTFNHAPYIEEALNGFVIQETNFPFVCAIVDDASTDGEQEVIKNYLNEHFDLKDKNIVRHEETDDFVLTFARHKTNSNCYFVVLYLKYNHYSIRKTKAPYLAQWRVKAKYTAICEGDDYWIAKDKLQKQVDFMEQHKGHTLCIHAYERKVMTVAEDRHEIVRNYPFDMDVLPDKDVLKGTGMLAATASMLYRRSALYDYPEWTRKAPIGDKPLQLVLFARGHIGYINEVMSVYRVGTVSSWSLKMRRSLKYRIKTQKGIIKFYHDFDEWTNGKYHEQIEEGIKEFRRLSFIDNMHILLHRTYSTFKDLLRFNRK